MFDDNNDIVQQEQRMRFGSRKLDQEKPGTIWDPPEGELFMQSLFHEEGVKEEYGEDQKLVRPPLIDGFETTLAELNPYPAGDSILPLDDARQMQLLNRRLRTLARRTLENPQLEGSVDELDR